MRHIDVLSHIGLVSHTMETVERAAAKSLQEYEAVDLACDAAVREALVTGSERTFEQDAGFGLIVLAEIALRALSPAVNDPGTANAVLGSQTRLLIEALATPLDAGGAKVCYRVTATAAEPQALVANVPAAVQTAALELVQRVLARASRSGADTAELTGWYAAATSLKLTPTDRGPKAEDDGQVCVACKLTFTGDRNSPVAGARGKRPTAVARHRCPNSAGSTQQRPAFIVSELVSGLRPTMAACTGRSPRSRTRL